MTVGTYCGADEIPIRETNGVSIYKQVSSRLKVGS
jgi:hypothetical protein